MARSERSRHAVADIAMGRDSADGVEAVSYAHAHTVHARADGEARVPRRAGAAEVEPVPIGIQDAEVRPFPVRSAPVAAADLAAATIATADLAAAIVTTTANLAATSGMDLCARDTQRQSLGPRVESGRLTST